MSEYDNYFWGSTAARLGHLGMMASRGSVSYLDGIAGPALKRLTNISHALSRNVSDEPPTTLVNTAVSEIMPTSASGHRLSDIPSEIAKMLTEIPEALSAKYQADMFRDSGNMLMVPSLPRALNDAGVSMQ